MHGLFMNHSLPTPFAICPQCGKIAIGRFNINSYFGTRVPNTRRVPQSNCRVCRKRLIREPNLSDIITDKEQLHSLLLSEKLFIRCNSQEFNTIYNNVINDMFYDYENDAVVSSNDFTVICKYDIPTMW